MSVTPSWDIFCNVIDNYGDIGVSWRLARQLCAEHGLHVRLWVDDLPSLQKLCPEINPGLPSQCAEGVQIRHWYKPFSDEQPADVVIEAFGCVLPECYVELMAESEHKPVWINLEYLTAEDWVTGCHGVPSPHPRLPLVKYFFFPGFVAGAGGLLLEKGLMREAKHFRRIAAENPGFWAEWGLPEPKSGELRVSLFGYENKAVADLFDAWSQAEFPVCCLVPEGRILEDVSAYFARADLLPGTLLSKGALDVWVIPFVEQTRYDQLLWACDCNFVRGEDSFVRAQWAAKPFIWHIYPQDEETHFKKLAAFLDIYCADLPSEIAHDVRQFWEAWNRQGAVGMVWNQFWKHRAVLDAHAAGWAKQLAQKGDLASNLVQFCKNKL